MARPRNVGSGGSWCWVVVRNLRRLSSCRKRTGDLRMRQDPQESKVTRSVRRDGSENRSEPGVSREHRGATQAGRCNECGGWGTIVWGEAKRLHLRACYGLPVPLHTAPMLRRSAFVSPRKRVRWPKSTREGAVDHDDRSCESRAVPVAVCALSVCRKLWWLSSAAVRLRSR